MFHMLLGLSILSSATMVGRALKQLRVTSSDILALLEDSLADFLSASSGCLAFTPLNQSFHGMPFLKSVLI